MQCGVNKTKQNSQIAATSLNAVPVLQCGLWPVIREFLAQVYSWPSEFTGFSVTVTFSMCRLKNVKHWVESRLPVSGTLLNCHSTPNHLKTFVCFLEVFFFFYNCMFSKHTIVSNEKYRNSCRQKTKKTFNWICSCL